MGEIECPGAETFNTCPFHLCKSFSARHSGHRYKECMGAIWCPTDLPLLARAIRTRVCMHACVCKRWMAFSVPKCSRGHMQRGKLRAPSASSTAFLSPSLSEFLAGAIPPPHQNTNESRKEPHKSSSAADVRWGKVAAQHLHRSKSDGPGPLLELSGVRARFYLVTFKIQARGVGWNSMPLSRVGDLKA